MSKTVVPIEYYTLTQAIAWIAFQDPEHPLRHPADLTPGTYPLDGTTDALAAPDVPNAASWLRVPASNEGRRLWGEAAAHDGRVRRAALALCQGLTDGRLRASGDLLTAGRAAGEAITCRREDPIAAAELACEIPLEWLHNRDGWLVISAATDATDSDRKLDRHYCHVRIAAASVQRAWPASTVGATESADASPVRSPSGYEESDKPLVEEMLRLLTCGEAKNPWQAAQKAATSPEVKGSTMGNSKAKRLLGRFNKRYPDFQNCSV